MELLLPKGYLSWSQIQLWESSKDNYRKKYYHGEEVINNAATRFGKASAEKREKGDEAEIPEHLRYALREYKLDTTVMGVRCIGQIDACHDSFHAFREDKTGQRDKKGRAPWDMVKVHKHDQLVMYATLLKWQHGVVPSLATLVWIETEKESGLWGAQVSGQGIKPRSGIRATGHVKTFDRLFHEGEIIRMEQKILRVAGEISKDYQDYINEL